jgi:hypothetical protein
MEFMHDASKIRKLRLVLSLLIANVCIFQPAHANLAPRFSANGYGSQYTVGQADLLIPIVGNSVHSLYADPNVSYATNNQGYADLGFGYRWIQNKAAILGGYLFASYSRINNDAHLVVTNPGIEALGSRWDAHLNGYIVAGDRNRLVGTFVGSQLGLKTMFVSGHARYDSLFQLMQNTGHGADAQLGFQLFPHCSLKGYVGSYFFSPTKTPNIWGGAAGLEYWLHQNVKVFAGYTYDNLRHSTTALGLGVEFGGTRINRSDPILEERMTDSVARNLAALGQGSSIPSRTQLKLLTGPGMHGSAVIPIATKISFFRADAPTVPGELTIDDCTAENPCGGGNLTQADVDELHDLDVADELDLAGPGTYGIGEDNNNELDLYEDQMVQGTTEDFLEPAVPETIPEPLLPEPIPPEPIPPEPIPPEPPEPAPEEPVPPPPAEPEVVVRPIMHGTLKLASNDTISAVITEPETGLSTGIIMSNVENVRIKNTSVGEAGDPFFVGINATGSQVTMQGVTVFADSQGIVTDSTQLALSQANIYVIGSTGISAKNKSTVSISDTLIDVFNSSPGAIGLRVQNSNATVTNSVINAAMSSTSPSAQAIAIDSIMGSAVFVASGKLSASGGSVIPPAIGVVDAISKVQLTDSVICILNDEPTNCP